MLVVAARIDADTTAVGLTLRAAATRGAYATAANTAGTGLLARPAMFGIGGEVAAAVDGAAIRHTDGAIRTLADSAPALDGNEITLANLAARPTVVQVGLEIDAGAGPGQSGEPCLTGRGIALCGRSTSRAAARDCHRGQESDRLPA